jgi:hypothetical protein
MKFGSAVVVKTPMIATAIVRLKYSLLSALLPVPWDIIFSGIIFSAPFPAMRNEGFY